MSSNASHQILQFIAFSPSASHIVLEDQEQAYAHYAYQCTGGQCFLRDLDMLFGHWSMHERV